MLPAVSCERRAGRCNHGHIREAERRELIFIGIAELDDLLRLNHAVAGVVNSDHVVSI
jgi:hypothetical protein